MGVKLNKDYEFVNDEGELKKVNMFYHSSTEAFGLDGDLEHITLELLERVCKDLIDYGLVEVES